MGIKKAPSKGKAKKRTVKLTSISILGIEIQNKPRDVKRIDTRLHGLNLVIGGGYPVCSIMEISGPTWSGKTTLCLYLSGMVDPRGTICVHDNEKSDYKYVIRVLKLAGWSGKLWYTPGVTSTGRIETAEKALQDLIDHFTDTPEATAMVVDTVGSLYTAGEDEGDIGEGRVGQRSRVIGDFNRKAINKMNWKERDSGTFLANHVHQVIGKFGGTVTSGGKSMEDKPVTRLRVWAARKDGWWEQNVTSIKLRYWENEPVKNCQIIILPGKGVHPGLTAVNDAILFGIAKRDKVISLGGKSYGFWSKIVDKWEDDDLFAPFQKALAQQRPTKYALKVEGSEE